MKTHEENLKLYLENGGDPKIANRHRLPTIQNRAKISYLLSQLSINKWEQSTKVKIEIPKVEVQEEERFVDKLVNEFSLTKPKFLGFISQYPVELHSTYQDCYNTWLDVCRFKIELNLVRPYDVEDAYILQKKIFKSIGIFDRHKKALDYWLSEKRIIKTESKKDYSKFTPLELDQERRNLASLITRRKQTIAKKESELPSPEASDYRKKYETLQFKKEQLEEFILDQNKILETLNIY